MPVTTGCFIIQNTKIIHLTYIHTCIFTTYFKNIFSQLTHIFAILNIYILASRKHLATNLELVICSDYSETYHSVVDSENSFKVLTNFTSQPKLSQRYLSSGLVIAHSHSSVKTYRMLRQAMVHASDSKKPTSSPNMKNYIR